MLHVFAKTCVGYGHINERKPCQDFSAIYQDKKRTIITCCDGHGGEVYVRSEQGSKMASEAVINVFNRLNNRLFKNYTLKEIEDNIRLQIICEWNKSVEESLSETPISKTIFKKLSEDNEEKLKNNPVKAYGTTLTGAVVYGNILVIVNIGDTECVTFYNGVVKNIFDEEDDPVGNQTYSMCQEDAREYFRVRVMDLKEVDGVILCTDGLSSPYQSYENFNNSFVKPLVYNIVKNNDYHYAENIVQDIALKYGIGDDVSLAFIIKDKTKLEYYKKPNLEEDTKI